MKKTGIVLLIAVMLLSLGWGGMKPMAAAADEKAATQVEFSDILTVGDKIGVTAGENAGHGGHQTRVVHTSHGDYVAYATDSLKGDGGKEMNEMSVIKVDSDGTTTVVLQEYKPYDSSQISIMLDTEENVWAVIAGNDTLKDQFDGRAAGLWLAAYCIDAKTDEASGYTTILLPESIGGFGYSHSVYDPSQQKIYVMSMDGNNSPSPIYWTIFDLETRTWEGRVFGIYGLERHAYDFIYPDGKGGMVVVNGEDYLAAAAGYPEIGSNYGLTEEDLKTFGRWSANYVWHQLDMIYIPNVYAEDYEIVTVAPKDYSKVFGTQEERYTLEFRAKNLYPNISNGYGDAFIDAEGYMHVVYCKDMLRAAYDRAPIESDWYHVVFDISDPANMHKVSESHIVDQKEDASWNSFRMYQSASGKLYLISGRCSRIGHSNEDVDGKVIVYEVNGTAKDGYTYTALASKETGGGYVVNISTKRSNSLNDNSIGVIWGGRSGDYDYMQITLKEAGASVDEPETPETGDTMQVWVWALMAGTAAGMAWIVKDLRRKAGCR